MANIHLIRAQKQLRNFLAWMAQEQWQAVGFVLWWVATMEGKQSHSQRANYALWDLFKNRATWPWLRGIVSLMKCQWVPTLTPELIATTASLTQEHPTYLIVGAVLSLTGSDRDYLYLQSGRFIVVMMPSLFNPWTLQQKLPMWVQSLPLS